MASHDYSQLEELLIPDGGATVAAVSKYFREREPKSILGPAPWTLREMAAISKDSSDAPMAGFCVLVERLQKRNGGFKHTSGSFRVHMSRPLVNGQYDTTSFVLWCGIDWTKERCTGVLSAAFRDTDLINMGVDFDQPLDAGQVVDLLALLIRATITTATLEQ